MTHQLERQAGLPGGCAKGAFAITAADSDLAIYARGFHISVAGICKITTLLGDVVSPSLAAGYHPIAITRFWSTGTDAAVKAGTIMGLYDSAQD